MFSRTLWGRRRHDEHLARHCHRESFAALVLSGGYVEAGDRGRLRVGPGNVVLHGSFESHLDRFASAGAEVMVLLCDQAEGLPELGRVLDPDLVVRLGERDPHEAAACLFSQFEPASAGADDWPDRLARELRADPDLSIHVWADRAGLRRESISRGFRRAYGITPLAYRARARALKALRRIRGSEPLAQVAAACGFADQPHMTRSIRELTGRSPGDWRITNQVGCL